MRGLHRQALQKLARASARLMPCPPERAVRVGGDVEFGAGRSGPGVASIPPPALQPRHRPALPAARSGPVRLGRGSAAPVPPRPQSRRRRPIRRLADHRRPPLVLSLAVRLPRVTRSGPRDPPSDQLDEEGDHRGELGAPAGPPSNLLGALAEKAVLNGCGLYCERSPIHRRLAERRTGIFSPAQSNQRYWQLRCASIG